MFVFFFLIHQNALNRCSIDVHVHASNCGVDGECVQHRSFDLKYIFTD